jgi:membrane protein implicated in regulation of membrane protease activity
VGQEGVARDAIGPGEGRVAVNGEVWSARVAEGVEVPAGAPVRVVRVHTDDLTVTVEPREG